MIRMLCGWLSFSPRQTTIPMNPRGHLPDPSLTASATVLKCASRYGMPWSALFPPPGTSSSSSVKSAGLSFDRSTAGSGSNGCAGATAGTASSMTEAAKGPERELHLHAPLVCVRRVSAAGLNQLRRRLHPLARNEEPFARNDSGRAGRRRYDAGTFWGGE